MRSVAESMMKQKNKDGIISTSNEMACLAEGLKGVET